MTGLTFLFLSLGLIGYLSKFYLDKNRIYYKLLTWISVLLMILGVVALSFNGYMGAILATLSMLLIIVLAKGLESDKRFLKELYSQIDEYRKDDPQIGNAEVMKKIINTNFPKIGNSIVHEIIVESEDIEEMIYKAVEYDTSGKIRKPYPPENLDDLED